MKCDDVRPRLTAYLDGELEGDRGTVVRGHLRSCEACRQVASDEAALRDGLRALPTLDPPPAMWATIQAQLAASEVAEA
ncbi:MAG: zf-HC2 domain-containing protein, partial [Myxococcota bacterium]|nr:zf-HC2 domain-containing protein [Myxococcota bacterium]